LVSLKKEKGDYPLFTLFKEAFMKEILSLVILILVILIAFPVISHAVQANPKVLIKTSKGDITLELFADKAPITVNNFLSYVDEKFYNGTIFHRVIKDFMIQGGGFTPEFLEKATKPPIKNEAANGLKNLRGTIAMARTPEIDSATCQFFINHVDNLGLDHKDNTEHFGYAVFGKVVSGMDVVDAIASVLTMTKGINRDVPRETITIISISRI
jgi:cyclophilin family peptidyl-prolyl cis-trans isomerase